MQSELVARQVRGHLCFQCPRLSAHLLTEVMVSSAFQLRLAIRIAAVAHELRNLGSNWVGFYVSECPRLPAAADRQLLLLQLSSVATYSTTLFPRKPHKIFQMLRYIFCSILLLSGKTVSSATVLV